MCHQIGLSSLCFNSPSTSLQEPLLRFCVKFYTPDPAQIEEEYTRYLFSLQIKRDLGTGLLQCNDNTAALMASYIVQGKFNKLYLLYPIILLIHHSSLLYANAYQNIHIYNNHILGRITSIRKH